MQVSSADNSRTARPTSPVVARGLRVPLGGHEILHGIDVHVDAHETVALLGGNGSGKTTLVRSLMGLVPADSGEIELFGTPLRRFHGWREIGYVPQRGQLQIANATVDEVVRSGRLGHRKPFMPLGRADRSAIDRALERVSLGNLRQDQMTHLSGGQQQRALIARALASEPKLLVLDEPLAGLDLITQQALADLIGELKQDGLGLLVVLHELGPLEPLIDRSVVLREGRVIHDGPLLGGAGTEDAHHLPHSSNGRLFDDTLLAPSAPSQDMH